MIGHYSWVRVRQYVSMCLHCNIYFGIIHLIFDQCSGLVYYDKKVWVNQEHLVILNALPI